MITWQIDHDQRLVTALGRDTITLADITRYLGEVAAAAGMPYAKLLDARFTALQLSALEMRSVVESVKRYADQGKLGPIAMVIDVDLTEIAAELFQQKTANSNRPFRIFRDVDSAMQWLGDRAGEAAA